MADSGQLEKLFLLEILIDYVAYDCDDIVKGLKETCVTFQFLNYPSISICEEDFAANDNGYDDKEICFNSGKSCLFSLHGKFLTKNVDLEVTVFRKNDSGDCVQIGRTLVPLGNSFVNLFENAPVEMSDEPKSKTVRDHYTFFDEKNNSVGKLGVLVRLSCFGPLIVTQFEIKSPSNEEFLFKNNSSVNKPPKQGSSDRLRSTTSLASNAQSPSNYPQPTAFPPSYYPQKDNYQTQQPQSQYGGTGSSSNRVCQPCNMQVPSATPFSPGCPCGEEQMQEILTQQVAFPGQKCAQGGQFLQLPASQECPSKGFPPYGRGLPPRPPSRGFPPPPNQGFQPSPTQGFPPPPPQGFPQPPPGMLRYPPQSHCTQMEVPNMYPPPCASSPQLTPARSNYPPMPSYRPQTSTGRPQGACDRTTCPEFFRSQGQGSGQARPQSAFPQIPMSPCYYDSYNPGGPPTWPPRQQQERYPGVQPNSINAPYSLQNVVPPSSYPRSDTNQIKTQSADAFFNRLPRRECSKERFPWLIEELEKSGPRKGDIVCINTNKDDDTDRSAPDGKLHKDRTKSSPTNISDYKNESKIPSDPTLFEVPAHLRGPRPGDFMCWGGKGGDGPSPGVRAIWIAEEVKGEPDKLCWVGREVVDNEVGGVLRPEKESARPNQTIWKTKPGEPLPPISPQSQKPVDLTSRVVMPRSPVTQVHPSKIQTSNYGPTSPPTINTNQPQIIQQMQQFPADRGDPGPEPYFAAQGHPMMGQFPPPMVSRSMGNLVGPSMEQPPLPFQMSCGQLPTVSSISFGGTPVAPGGYDSDDSSSSDSDDGKFPNLSFCDCDIPLPPGFGEKSKSKKKKKPELDKPPPICAVTCGDPRCCLNKFTTSEYKCTRIATQGSTGKLAYLANQAVFNTGDKSEPANVSSVTCPTYTVSNNTVSRPQLVQVVDPLKKTKEDIKNDTFLLNFGKTDCSGKPAKLNLTFKTPKAVSQICTNDSAIQCVPEQPPKKEGKKGKGKKDKGKKGKKKGKTKEKKSKGKK